MKQVRILHFSIGGSDFTGIANFLYQYYKNIDRNLVHFDFVFAGTNSMKLVADDPIFKDSLFVELNTISDKKDINYFQMKKGVEKLLESGNYDVFHINTHRVGVTLACIVAAKKCKIKTIISHSHNVRRFIVGRSRKRLLANFAKSIVGEYIRRNCDYLFACSNNAGIALFGASGIKMKKFKVIKNAIDLGSNCYDESLRKEIREREHVNDSTIVLGHIGRLSVQKNQMFSLKILSELIKRNFDVELWLIGTGEDKVDLERITEELNISCHTRFWGQRNDVAQLFQAMDGVLFPSTYEGLGIVAIEAQAAGLPIYASTEIPPETQITDLISYLPLAEGEEKWADYIILDIPKHIRRNTYDEIKNSGFEISIAAKCLEDIYINCEKKS